MATSRGPEAWNAAVKRGETFVSSGPMIRLAVNGAGPGARIDLPGGGELDIEAELTSPRPLRKLEIVRNGEVIATAGPGDRKLGIRTRVPADRSCWIAARGIGGRIPAMEEDEVAHTGIVQVLVGGKRIWSERDAAALAAKLLAQKEIYRSKARYARDEDRQRMLGIFDDAVGAVTRKSKVRN